MNVLVDPSGRACVADFGISAISDPQIVYWTSQSSANSKGGSVRWQAPELHNPEDDTKAAHNTKESDVYAWACLCYEVFSLEPSNLISSYATILLDFHWTTPLL